MNLKKYLSILTIFIICLSMVGCFKKVETKKTTQSSSVEEKSQQVQNLTNTLATQKNYIVYSAKASDHYSDYSPLNVLDDDSNSSWVLNDSEKKGIGGWIKISFSDKIEVNKLYILNGLGYNSDNKKSYHKDNRVKNLEVEFSNGQKQEIDLEDDNIEEQEIVLNKPIETDYVKFTIKDIYDGNERPYLTCIGSIGINYPRVNGNEDKTNNFVGLYKNYGGNIEKDKKNKKVKLYQITKYIDFKENLTIEQRVQYLANMLVSSGESIKISKDNNNKLIAKLKGEYLISSFRDATCDGVIEKAFIEGNLLQYYYEGDDWIDSIQIDCGDKTFDIDKSDFKRDFLDNKENYNYLIGKTSDEKNNSKAADENNSDLSLAPRNLGEEHPAEDYSANNVKYNSKEALMILLKHLKTENQGDDFIAHINYEDDIPLKLSLEQMKVYPETIEAANKIPLKKYHSNNQSDKIGYVINVAVIVHDEEDGMTTTLSYFVDAYSGYIYYYDYFNEFIDEIISK